MTVSRQKLQGTTYTRFPRSRELKGTHPTGPVLVHKIVKQAWQTLTKPSRNLLSLSGFSLGNNINIAYFIALSQL